MRRPGESLSHELVRLNDRFDWDMWVFLVLPLVATALPCWLLHSLARANPFVVLGTWVALLVATLVYGIQKLLGTITEIRNKRLALYGERVVGDRLMDLTEHGYQVFHDVPCVGGGGRFNLDHVVVGNGAVVVVETKTYRKPRNVPENHKVAYDGQQLRWPGWSSTEELQQVEAGATWLRAELKKKLNFDVAVRAALTMPGWYVTGGPPRAPVLVENVKRLPQFIRERYFGTLHREQEKLIRNHLRSMCETVDFRSMSDGL